MDEEPLVYCPSCGKAGLRRLISAPRFRLKGGGWYETDFKKDKQRNLAKSDAEPTKTEKGEASGSGAGEDKSAGSKKSSGTTSGGKVDSA